MVDKKTITSLCLRIILAISIIYYHVQLLCLRKITFSAIPLWRSEIIRTDIHLREHFKIVLTYTTTGIQDLKYTVHVRYRVSYKMYSLESFRWVTFVLMLCVAKWTRCPGEERRVGQRRIWRNFRRLRDFWGRWRQNNTGQQNMRALCLGTLCGFRVSLPETNITVPRCCRVHCARCTTIIINGTLSNPRLPHQDHG